MPMTRRQFLWSGAGAALAATGAGLYGIQPRRRTLAAAPGSDRFRQRVRVAVIGGGLAGMSAALELAERGAEVTLFERGNNLGGKLSGWPITIGGETFAMEHGFHGFFAQYYNTFDCLKRLRLTSSLRPAQSYPLLSPDGGCDDFRGQGGIFPANLLRLYLTSKQLKLSGALTTRQEMRDLMAYGPRTQALYDGESFDSFARGLDANLTTSMLLPFAKTTLNSPEHLSAAYALMFMHFYFLGNPEGLRYSFTDNDCVTDIVAPWAARLSELGVQIRRSTEVAALVTSGQRVSAVAVGQDAAPTLIAELPASLGTQPEMVGMSGALPIYAWKSGATPVAVLGRCTHQGCPVRLAADGFICPCHGGRYDREGLVISGPPKDPLPRLNVHSDGRIFTLPGSAETFACDEVVLACDVRAAQKLIGPRTGLSTADPYLVVRLWLNRRARGDRAGFYTTRGFSLLDAIAIYDRLQKPYADYSARSQNGVVELHAYAIPPTLDRGPEANADFLFAELGRALPELADARVLHREVMQKNDFSGFLPGSVLTRPGTVIDYDNLFLAGDWVRTGLPVALMEAAVTSGRLAANAICRKYSVAGAAVESVPETGILA